MAEEEDEEEEEEVPPHVSCLCFVYTGACNIMCCDTHAHARINVEELTRI